MTRVITSVLLIPTITWVVLFAPHWAFVAVVALFASLCWHEYAGIAVHYGARFHSLAGFLPGLAYFFAPAQESLLLLLIALAAVVVAMRVKDLKDAVPSAALFAFGLLYVFGAWRSAVALHAIDPYWLLFALTINWVGDSAAFYVGRTFGKQKMAPRVSPAKSWEGAAGSLLFAGLFGVFLVRWALPGTPLQIAAIFAICGNAAGQLGDLAESALKRGAGVKDSGTLLPGHGGWLDRLDSSLFSMPVVYALLLVFPPAR